MLLWIEPVRLGFREGTSVVHIETNTWRFKQSHIGRKDRYGHGEMFV